MSDTQMANGHVTVEKQDNPPPPSEAILIDGIKEVPLTGSQVMLLSELSAQAQAASEAADAAVAVARVKQGALDQALRMVLQIADVNDDGYHSLLDRQRSVLRLVPSSNIPR